MAATAKTVSLAEFVQDADTLLASAASGNLVKVVDGEREVFLVSAELMLLITTCLLPGEMTAPR
ncbi:MAG: hypothetical protein ACI4ML_03550 [Aristaeellaceae bacterium]